MRTALSSGPLANAEKKKRCVTALPPIVAYAGGTMSAVRGSICLATPEFLGLTRNGGIGVSYSLLAHLLADHGWQVHVLYCGENGDPETLQSVRHRLSAAGIGFTCLAEYPVPPSLQVPSLFPAGASIDRSDRLSRALMELHCRQRFDLIQFVDWLGLGFRPMQAKRMQLALGDVGTIVKLHGMQQWVREHNHGWLASPAMMIDEYAERHAFEHADVQMGASRYILDYARGLGWQVRDDALVCPNPLGAPRVPKPQIGEGPPKLVFFGRLEMRKGYELFVQALDGIDPALPVVFLGKDVLRQDGQPASEWVKDRLSGRQVSFLTEYDRDAALHYLASGNRLAIIPSLSENHPHAVVECVVNGIPFLAARSGGIPEVVNDPDLQAHLLFEPTAAELRQRLNRYLQASSGVRQGWCDRLREQADGAAHNCQVVATYERLLAAVTERRTAVARHDAVRRRTPLVSVAVPHYNLGEYLPATLASLAAQSYPRLEVLVLDDGSSEPASQHVFERMARAYPHFRFVRHANGGLAATRNRALAEATGDYFFPLDADNLIAPTAIETLVRAMDANRDCSAVTCYLLAFDDARQLAGEAPFSRSYRATAGPLVLGSLCNIFGDASGLFRTSDLRSVGGYDPHRDVILEDWHAYVKLIGAGFRVEVVPDHLLFYRIRPDSMLRTGCELTGQLRIIHEYARAAHLPSGDLRNVWAVLFGLRQELERTRQQMQQAQQGLAGLRAEMSCLRHRLANKANSLLRSVPLLHPLSKTLARAVLRAWRLSRPLVARQAAPAQG